MNSLSFYKDPFLKDSIKIFDHNGRVVNHEINTFPDGQIQIKIKKSELPYDRIHILYDEDEKLTVYGSLFNPSAVDLFFQCIETFPVNKIKINYLYGARSDKDESGDYLVSNTAQLTCGKIAEQFYDENQVEFLAPHCYPLCEGIGIINFDLPDCVNLDDYDLVIYPDESAQKRFTKVNKDFIICEKHRDQETGQILSHVIPNLPSTAKRVLILDDLCDGGATFINVAEALPDSVEADLFIFHGVFSNCAPIRLFAKYKNIFVSNSLPHVQQMANDFAAWKDGTMKYKTFTAQYGIEKFTQYKGFVPGNLIVFDVWNHK
jgi:hypothetical protein